LEVTFGEGFDEVGQGLYSEGGLVREGRRSARGRGREKWKISSTHDDGNGHERPEDEEDSV
jgi:hypothetical protein